MERSFQNKLNNLEARLKAENDERNKTPDAPDFSLSVPSPRRPKPFGDFSFNPKRPPKGLSLGTGLPGQPGSGLQRRKHNFQLPCSPQQTKPPDSHEIEQKYQEIMKASGILTLDGTKVTTQIDELEPLGELGHGTCGHVVKMRHKRTGHLMAVKQMRRSGNREENKRIIMDLDVVLKSHDCPYIVQCLGTFITSSDVWICMELMSTCLDKLLKKLKCPIPEHILGKVAVATVNALNYLKDEHGVIHRDVKPSNILMDEHGRIKLCDFGISGRLVDSKAKTRSAGCAAYMAPERIDPPDPTKPDYDIRADVWSLGVSLVELATGEFPYKNCKTDFEVLTKVLEEDPPLLPAGRGFSMNFCMFVRDCLTKDYRRRPKYRKLLEHPYIQKYEKSFVNVAGWYANVMGIERPKAQIQQPPSYFARSESYAGHPGPSPIITPLTTPSIDFGLSQPMFPMATSSPSYSDGWPSPQSTSSRVDFSLGYSPSPSPSPSPSGPFNTSGDSAHLGDTGFHPKPMDCSISQGRSPNYNQMKPFDTMSTQSCTMEVSQGSPAKMAFNMSLSQPVLNPGHATEMNRAETSSFTFGRIADSAASSAFAQDTVSESGFADFSNMGRRCSTKSEPQITLNQGNGTVVYSTRPHDYNSHSRDYNSHIRDYNSHNRDYNRDYNSHSRGFSLDFNQIGQQTRRISDNAFPIGKSNSSHVSYGKSPKQNNGLAMSMSGCHASNPFNVAHPTAATYGNNSTPTPTAKACTNPFLGNPFNTNPFNNH